MPTDIPATIEYPPVDCTSPRPGVWASPAL